VKTGIGIAFLVGLSIATALIAYYGFGEIAAALKGAGWGLAAITVLHLLPLGCSALGWRAINPREHRVSVLDYLGARWVREAVNGLLPVAQIGGNVVAARLVALRGVKGAQAGAGVVADVGTEVLTQALFTLLGLGLFFFAGPAGAHLGWMLAGSIYLVISAVGFFYAQRIGLFKLLEQFLDKLAERFPSLSMGDVNGLHDAIVRIHDDHRALLMSGFWHLASWVVGVAEVWLGLQVLGHPVGWQEAFVLESLGQAVRGAAFMIPGGLGVQEGGYLLLGTLYGLSPEVSLALSLTKRVRELGLGLPALAAWQLLETWRLFRSRLAPPS
jgi:putative membrane protein